MAEHRAFTEQQQEQEAAPKLCKNMCGFYGELPLETACLVVWRTLGELAKPPRLPSTAPRVDRAGKFWHLHKAVSGGSGYFWLVVLSRG